MKKALVKMKTASWVSTNCGLYDDYFDFLIVIYDMYLSLRLNYAATSFHTDNMLYGGILGDCLIFSCSITNIWFLFRICWYFLILSGNWAAIPHVKLKSLYIWLVQHPHSLLPDICETYVRKPAHYSFNWMALTDASNWWNQNHVSD